MHMHEQIQKFKKYPAISWTGLTGRYSSLAVIPLCAAPPWEAF